MNAFDGRVPEEVWGELAFYIWLAVCLHELKVGGLEGFCKVSSGCGYNVLVWMRRRLYTPSWQIHDFCVNLKFKV